MTFSESKSFKKMFLQQVFTFTF